MMLFAIPGAEQLGAFGVKCLAVAGGFVVGYLLGALGTWAFAKKSPDMLKKAVRVLAGIALALLIAFIVFGDGKGGGWLGGGDGPPGPGTSAPEASKTQATSPEEKPPPRIVPKDTTEYETLTVAFLGGDDVQGNRFYKLDGSEAMTFEQLKAAILKLKETVRKPLKLERQFSSDPARRISKDSANVREVERWAEAQGIKTP